MNRWLPAFAVSRPVTVIMAFVALLLLGTISLNRIPLDMFPEGFEHPYIWVWLPYGNTTPLETEARIVKPVEEQLATLGGIKSLESSSSTRGGSIEIEFHQSTDLAVAYNQVVDRMERVMPDLPSDVDRYWIYRWNPSDEPKVWLGMTIPDDAEDPHRLVTEIVQKRLERIGGVGQVDVWGVNEKIVWIDLDREGLAAAGVNLADLVGRLSNDNFQLSGGRITDRGAVRYLRSLARWQDLDDLRAFPVKEGVTLQDVAKVHYRAEDSKHINRLNGSTAAAVGVTKESGSNTVEVCRDVRRVINELEHDPRLAGFEFHVFFDQGEEIENSLGNLKNTAVQGGLFALVVLFLFLREWRMTLLIAGCIPFSLLITVVVLYFTGGTLNLLSMAGLMIAVGMVVDNAIVVVETIFRARQQGLPRKDAAVAGAAEVSLAITLSTMTTMVVFMPIILMSDNAMFSFFMGELGFPVVWALAASLLVALVFTPLTTLFISRRDIVPDARWLGWLTRLYERALRGLLNHRLDTFVWIVAMVFLTVQVPMKAVGCNDGDDAQVTEFMVRFTVPSVLNQAERETTVRAFEKMVEDNKGRWGVDVYRTRLRESSMDGWLWVQLQDDDERREDALPRADIMDDVKEKLPDLPGGGVRLGWEGDPLGKRSISVALYGEETEVLDRLSREVVRRLEAQPGFLGANTSAELEGPQEIRLNLDREATFRYGLNGETIGQSVAFAMRGYELRELRQNGHDVTVYARFSEEDRQDLQTLLDFPLFVSPAVAAAIQTDSATSSAAAFATAAGSADAALTTIPVRAVTHPEVARGWGTIRRENRRTGMSIDVDLDTDMEPDAAYKLAEQVLTEMQFPRGYGWEKGRQFEDQQESNQAQQLALLLSITFVFLLMGVLFESFILPLSVITTVPMAMLGVYWTLYLTDTPLDVMGGVGLVVLIDVVVNNGIVLVDLVTRLRNEGMERVEALVQAGKRRFRPILMTALTTFFGLLPMAVGDTQFLDVPYAPLGRVVAGGLATATVLTLFLVPLLYTLLDDLRAASRRWLAWVWPRGGQA